MDGSIEHGGRTVVSRCEGLELLAGFQCCAAGGNREAAGHGLRIQDREDSFLSMIACASAEVGSADEDECSFVREQILLCGSLKSGMAPASSEQRSGPVECRFLIRVAGSRSEG